jgi:hypothetical protein
LRNQQSTEKPLPVLQIQEVYRAGNGVARCELFIFLICLRAESEIDPLFLYHQLKNFVKKDQLHFLLFDLLANFGLKLKKIAAVREDRMPGGRNSGAVYNLYKVSGVAL